MNFTVHYVTLSPDKFNVPVELADFYDCLSVTNFSDSGTVRVRIQQRFPAGISCVGYCARHRMN
jgi:hypothetical protein